MLQLTDSFSVFLQKRFLFRPVALPQTHRFVFDATFEEHWIETPDGAQLNALFFPSQQPNSRGVVLYFHGNRGNLQRWGQLHQDFTSRGFDFFIPDYRGYGKSSGEPNERAYFEDARLLYDRLHREYPADRIVLYGRSLGTGMASYLAAHVRARTLVLETPFDNIPGLLASYVGSRDIPLKPAFFFPNDRHIRQSPLQILIFHGTRDRVVPYASARNLQQYLKPDDRFVTVKDGSHNNLREFDLYQSELSRWLERKL